MSTISSGNTTTTAFVVTGDTTGNLVFTTGGANTTALTLSNTQAATFANNVTTSGLTIGTTPIGAGDSTRFKNRIINGDMRIDQRNAGASVTPTDGQYTLDRWQYFSSQASKFTVQQNAGSVTPPTGFINYLGATVASAVTIGSSDYFILRQTFEGLNIADLAWGTASAKTVTLSFQVYSSLTGTFGGTLTNNADNRSYPFTYTISTANTWTQISITVAGDTTGTWLTTNGSGIKLNLSLGMGSTYSGTAGAWAGAYYLSATGATSVVGTSGATFYITGVQLEVGSFATGFEYVDYTTQLVMCQRYFCKSYQQNVVPGANAGSTNCCQGINTSDGNQITGNRFPVLMRTTPTTAAWSLAGTSASLSTTGEVNSNINNGTWGPYAVGDAGFRALVGGGGLTANTTYLFHFIANAEL